MLKTLILSTLIVAFAFTGEGDKPTAADMIYDKAVADSTKKAEAAFSAYQKELEVAEQAVIKALESAKKDLNDPKKGKLTIQERAGAIEELDAKIAEVKKGAVGEGLVAKRNIVSGDLLGETRADLKVVVVGKWMAGNVALSINKDGSWTSPWADFGGTWRIIKGQLEFTANKGNTQTFTVDPKEGAKWVWNSGKSGGISARVAE